MKKFLLSFIALFVSCFSLQADNLEWNADVYESIAGSYCSTELGTYLNVTQDNLYYWRGNKVYDMTEAQITSEGGNISVTFEDNTFLFLPGTFGPSGVYIGEEYLPYDYYNLYGVEEFTDLDGLSFVSEDGRIDVAIIGDWEDYQVQITYTDGETTKTESYRYIVGYDLDYDFYRVNFCGEPLTFAYEGWDCTSVVWHENEYNLEGDDAGDAEKFAEYKSSLLQEIDVLSASASEAAQMIINEAKSQIEACEYDEDMGLIACKMQLFEIYNKLLEALDLAEGIDNIKIYDNAKAYDLQGRRTTTNHGIRICGGKKVMIK